MPSLSQLTTTMVDAPKAAATSAVEVGLTTLSFNSPVKALIAPSTRRKS